MLKNAHIPPATVASRVFAYPKIRIVTHTSVEARRNIGRVDLTGLRQSGLHVDLPWVIRRLPLRHIPVLATGAAALVLLMAATASAGTGDSGQILGPSEVQTTVARFFVPTLPRPVRVIVEPCPGDPTAQGCHSANRHIDTIWLNPQAGGLDDETVAHEMGHVFESYMWDLRWRQLPGSEFVPQTFFQIARILFDHSRPGILYSVAWSERFAEAYSACARFRTLSQPLSTGYYGFEVTPSQHQRICSSIDRMAAGYAQAAARTEPYEASP